MTGFENFVLGEVAKIPPRKMVSPGPYIVAANPETTYLIALTSMEVIKVRRG